MRVKTAAAACLTVVSIACFAAPGDASFVARAKETLAKELKDPGSVQYRGLFIASRDTPKGAELSLCGEMNAKNSYGGYGGFRPFIATEAGWAYFGDQIDALQAEYCGRKLRDVH